MKRQPEFQRLKKEQYDKNTWARSECILQRILLSLRLLHRAKLVLPTLVDVQRSQRMIYKNFDAIMK